MIDLAVANLTSPAVLAFVLALVAAALGTNLRLPEPVTAVLSTYLLMAIGIKGGAALRASSPGEVWRTWWSRRRRRRPSPNERSHRDAPPPPPWPMAHPDAD